MIIKERKLIVLIGIVLVVNTIVMACSGPCIIESIASDPAGLYGCPGTFWYCALLDFDIYECDVTWGGDVGDYVCDSGWSEWIAPGTYKVTADCGESSMSKTFIVVGVDSVAAYPTAICYNDQSGISITATPTPSGPLDCIQWRLSHKESDGQWSDWSILDSSCGESWTFDPSWYGTGYYQIQARNGEYDEWCDSVEFKVVRVDIEPQSNTPLPLGTICANAQSQYRQAPWKATVKPGGTSATVTVSGAATISGGSATVTDEQIFYPESIDEETTGNYTVTITHDDCSDCPVTSDDYTVFKFYVDGPYYDEILTTGGRTTDDSTKVGYLKSGKTVFSKSKDGVDNFEYSASLDAKYKFSIETEPESVYTGNVLVPLKINADTSGYIDMYAQTMPPDPDTFSLSINFGIMSASFSGQTGQIPYGSSLADTKVSLSHGSAVAYTSDISRNHEDFIGVFEPEELNGLDPEISTSETYNVGCEAIITCKIYSGSSSSKISLGKTFIWNNWRQIDDVTVEETNGYLIDQ